MCGSFRESMAGRIMKKQNHPKNTDVEFQLIQALIRQLSCKNRPSRQYVSAKQVQLFKKYFRSNASTSLFLQKYLVLYTQMQKENEFLKKELKLANGNGEWAIKTIKKIVQVILEK